MGSEMCIRDSVNQALAATGITHLQEREMFTLSGGERARVAFARVLAQRTPVVFLDEPTAAMDVRFQEQTMGVARTLARDGATVIVVLHDLQLAARYCDHVVCLKQGAVAAAGPVAEVYQDHILSEIYDLSLIHISEPTRLYPKSRMPSSA